MTDPRDETVVERPQVEDYFSFVPYYARKQTTKDKKKDTTVVTPRAVAASPSEDVKPKTFSETKNTPTKIPQSFSYTPFDELDIDSKAQKTGKTTSIITSKPVSPNPSEELDHAIKITPFTMPKVLSRNPSEEALKITPQESATSDVTTSSENSGSTSSDISSDISSITTACTSTEELQLHEPSEENLPKPTTPVDTAIATATSTALLSSDVPGHPELRIRRTASSSVLTVTQPQPQPQPQPQNHDSTGIQQPEPPPRTVPKTRHHETERERVRKFLLYTMPSTDDLDEEGIYFPPIPEERETILTAIVDTCRQKKFQFIDRYYRYNAWGDEDAVRHLNETVQYRRHSSISDFTVRVCKYLRLGRKVDKLRWKMVSWRKNKVVLKEDYAERANRDRVNWLIKEGVIIPECKPPEYTKKDPMRNPNYRVHMEEYVRAMQYGRM